MRDQEQVDVLWSVLCKEWHERIRRACAPINEEYRRALEELRAGRKVGE